MKGKKEIVSFSLSPKDIDLLEEIEEETGERSRSKIVGKAIRLLAKHIKEREGIYSEYEKFLVVMVYDVEEAHELFYIFAKFSGIIKASLQYSLSREKAASVLIVACKRKDRIEDLLKAIEKEDIVDNIRVIGLY